jgi:hypothetical protein
MVHAGPLGPGYSRRFRWFVSGGYGESDEGAQEGVRGVDKCHEALATFLAAQEPRSGPKTKDVCSWVVVGGAFFQNVCHVAEGATVCAESDVLCTGTVCDGIFGLEGVAHGNLESCALVMSVAPSGTHIGEWGWVACAGGGEVMVEGREGVVKMEGEGISLLQGGAPFDPL